MNDEILECFRLLDLMPDASRDEVRRAYRELVKVWHPDRFHNDGRLHSKAQEKLKEINLAYERIEEFLNTPQPQPESAAPPTGRRQPHQGQKAQDEESVIDQFNKGVASYNAGDIKGALEWFLKAARRGMADAQYRVGMLYKHHGRQHIFDGSKNFKETLLWLTKSAEQGHADAQFVVGEYHQSGFGTPYSATEAKKWYALAAKQGHREAKKRLTWYGFLWAYY